MSPGAAGLVALVAAGSWWGTGRVRRYARSLGVLDVPNDRSLHRVATPRGGGLAIAAAVIAAIGLGAILGWVPIRFAAAAVGGGGAVAWVGWRDDRRSLTPWSRLAVHLAAAVWALAWIGVPTTLAFGRSTLYLGLAGPLLALLWVLWLTNLFNFMDGIDGIAGVEAIVVGTVSAALFLGAGRDDLGLVSLVLAAAALGFLYWNWSPASIFMGDVGSGFLGFLFGILSVQSERVAAIPLWAWALLLGAFLFDTTLTLARRVVGGEAWYMAHRSHAYQRAVTAGRSHRAVCWAVLGLTSALGLLASAGVRSETPVFFLITGLVGLTTVYLVVERWEPMRRPPGERAST